MPGGSSTDPIVKLILDNLGPVVVILIGILGAIGKAAKGSSRPPTVSPGALPRPTPTVSSSSPGMAPPVTMPHANPSPQAIATNPQTAARPAGQPRFRPQSLSSQTSPSRGGSADQLAQERADIERFVREEKELQAGEPAALRVALTSPDGTVPTPSPLFAPESTIPGAGANTNLIRAIMLAQALGPRRGRSGQRRNSMP